MKSIIELKNAIEQIQKGQPILALTLAALVLQVEKEIASSSGGSVSCEAHRPDFEEIEKEFIAKFCIYEGTDFANCPQNPKPIINWIKEKIIEERTVR